MLSPQQKKTLNPVVCVHKNTKRNERKSMQLESNLYDQQFKKQLVRTNEKYSITVKGVNLWNDREGMNVEHFMFKWG